MSGRPRRRAAPALHVLVLANETVAGRTLLEAIEERAGEGRSASPSSRPRTIHVRATSCTRTADARAPTGACADARLLHEAGIAPAGRSSTPIRSRPCATRSTSTRPSTRSSSPRTRAPCAQLRGGLVERAQKVAKDIPVTHVEVDLSLAPRRVRARDRQPDDRGRPFSRRSASALRRAPSTSLVAPPTSRACSSGWSRRWPS